MPANEPEGAGPESDIKRKFKEALERKHGRTPDSAAGGTGEGKDASKVHGGTHGPASSQRTFRRKSGG